MGGYFRARSTALWRPLLQVGGEARSEEFSSRLLPHWEPMKILIVKLSSIGDVIHTLPALAELRRHFPSAELAWVVERSSAQLLRDNPALDHLIEIDTRAWRRRWLTPETWQQVTSLVARLRRYRFDLGFDFQGLFKSGLVLLLARARRRIGFETACLREKASRVCLTEQVPVSDEVHVIEKNLELVRALGIRTSGTYEFPLSLSDQDREVVERALTALGVKDFAILNPGGNWKGKRWSPPGYAAIAEYLSRTFGLVSLVTHAPDEVGVAHEVAEGAPRSAIPFPCTLKQLAVLADRAALFVGGDTGPLHLAAARRTPIVAIFGPTPGRRNGPFSPEDVVVQDPQARPRAYYRRRDDDHYINVSVDQVKDAIARRLARAGRSAVCSSTHAVADVAH